MSSNFQAVATRRQVERVDRILRACDQRGIDPIQILERYIATYDDKQQREASGAPPTVR